MTEMSGKILVTGATGFVGGRLLHALTALTLLQTLLTPKTLLPLVIVGELFFP